MVTAGTFICIHLVFAAEIELCAVCVRACVLAYIQKCAFVCLVANPD